MKITGIEINWHHGYGNSPTVVVNVDTRLRHDTFEYQCVPNNDNDKRSNVMLISTNNDPWVKFVYIDDPEGRPQYHGALGGDYKLTDGTVFHSRTGWSSRASVLNTKPEYSSLLRSHITEVTLRTDDETSYSLWAGYSCYVNHLKEHSLWPKDVYLIRDNNDKEFQYSPSVDPNNIVKAQEITN